MGAQRAGVTRPSPSASSWGSARPGRATSVTRGASLSAARRASSSSTGRPLPARASRRARAIHTGWLWVAASAARGSGASSARVVSQSSRGVRATRRRTALTSWALPAPVRSRARPTVSETAACCGTRMARSWWVPRRRTSSTGGSRRSRGRSRQCARIAS
ncbi:Uncharacterised protein [Mycobacteroides abscessus]|nr:Uncharacterised protein [Mycobacteroides abscessus]